MILLLQRKVSNNSKKYRAIQTSVRREDMRRILAALRPTPVIASATRRSLPQEASPFSLVIDEAQVLKDTSQQSCFVPGLDVAYLLEMAVPPLAWAGLDLLLGPNLCHAL
jgi:hypothetical protein